MNPLKIIDDKEKYIIIDSVTGEIFESYLKTGFTLDQINKILDDLNIDPKKTWDIHNLQKTGIADRYSISVIETTKWQI
jgi:hypothetical protein